jgi:hypothetical protein
MKHRPHLFLRRRSVRLAATSSPHSPARDDDRDGDRDDARRRVDGE